MQIVKYKWINWKPFIIAKDITMKAIPLFDNRISFIVGERRCTGFFKEGRHFECPEKRRVEFDYHCNECRLNDDFSLCIRCDGSQCINMRRRGDCKNEKYIVYLAAFNSILKIGISNEFRLMERLIEQGADIGAKVAAVQDGKAVRSIEQTMRKHLCIVDRVGGREKHDMLFGNPNTASINIFNAINKLRNNGFNEYLISPEIHDLRGYYRLQNVISSPEMIEIKENTKIEGDVVAAKGNIMVLKNPAHKFYSVNTHELIGREINFS